VLQNFCVNNPDQHHRKLKSLIIGINTQLSNRSFVSKAGVFSIVQQEIVVHTHTQHSKLLQNLQILSLEEIQILVRAQFFGKKVVIS